jgi:hypothetical protein
VQRQAGLAMSTAQAQDLRMYAFSSGALTLGKGILQNLAPLEPPLQLPVGFYLIRHPRGNVLFDTGNNDKLISDPSYWPPGHMAMKPVTTPDVAIDVQLRKVGVNPEDVNYVVLSHMHLDHAATPPSSRRRRSSSRRTRCATRSAGARHGRSLRPGRLLSAAQAL